MCTNGIQVPCEPPSPLNPTTRKGWPHHRGLRHLIFSNSDVGSFTSHNNKKGKVLWTGPTVFRPYPRRLESLTVWRCHYKGSTFFSVIFKRPWVLVRPGFEPATSLLEDRRPPNWANRASSGSRDFWAKSLQGQQYLTTTDISQFFALFIFNTTILRSDEEVEHNIRLVSDDIFHFVS